MLGGSLEYLHPLELRGGKVKVEVIKEAVANHAIESPRMPLVIVHRDVGEDDGGRCEAQAVREAVTGAEEAHTDVPLLDVSVPFDGHSVLKEPEETDASCSLSPYVVEECIHKLPDEVRA